MHTVAEAMHLAFLTTEYPPMPCGGIGTSVRTLARAAVALGHRVSVVGWGRETTFCDRGVRVRFLEETSRSHMGWLINRRRAHRALRQMVDHEGVQVVEAPDWCGPSAGMAFGCPTVIRCNGSAAYFAHLLGTSVARSVFAAEWLALAGAASVVAVSRYTAGITRTLFRRPDPIGTIPNGVDLEMFRPARSTDIEPGLLVYTGALARKKGVLDLCRAFSAIVERRPDARLCLIGRDVPDSHTGNASTWALCRERLSSRALRCTEYLGPRRHDLMPRELARAAMCVMPSYAEALPLAWLEAMASARPVIAYDIGWAREVIEPGATGMLVRSGDVDGYVRAVVDLLDDPDKAQRLGDAARRVAESKFSSAVVALQSLDWYARTIAERQ